ncbi:unnamed protein product, partial [Brassica rapa]|uniref:Uncharacterized protein n=1 Tax=Brassica campestris TaxID=3711 RepID=A0A3P5YAE6_BRACM
MAFGSFDLLMGFSFSDVVLDDHSPAVGSSGYLLLYQTFIALSLYLCLSCFVLRYVNIMRHKKTRYT